LSRKIGPVIETLASKNTIKSTLPATSEITKIVNSIGTKNFTKSLLLFGKSILKADFVSIFCLDDEQNPYLIDTECAAGHYRAVLAAEGYSKHFIDDVDYQLMGPEGANGDYTTYQTRDDIKSLQYRSDCYDKPRIADRRSAIRKKKAYALKLSFYRSKEIGEFDNSDRILLDGLLPLLFALTERHVAFYLKGTIAKADNNKSHLALSYPTLTKRELEVSSMILKGMTASEIAKELNVAVSTIITHKKKAYKRLGISNMRELMRL